MAVKLISKKMRLERRIHACMMLRRYVRIYLCIYTVHVYIGMIPRMNESK